MAIPLEPDTGFFPDMDEQAFVLAPELAELAGSVLPRWAELEPLRRAVVDEDVHITYVFETAPFDPARDEYKRHAIAKVTKAPALWNCLTGIDLVIGFRHWFWERFDATQREAVLYHEYRHVEVVPGKEKSDPPRVKLTPHDLEEFYGVARRYGDVLPDIEQLIKAHGMWRAEQPGGDVVQLRALEAPDPADGLRCEGSNHLPGCEHFPDGAPEGGE